MHIDTKTAEKFESYMLKYPKIYQELADIVNINLPKKIKKPLIGEIGIGSGLLSSEIKKKIPSSSIIGLDPSIEMLKIAQKRAYKTKNKKFEVLLSIAEKIPLKDESIDILITRFSISYWKNPHDGFSEIFRVLKPGGKLIIEALNRNFPKWKLKLINLNMLINYAGKEVIKYHNDAYEIAYTINEMEEFLINLNFINTKKMGTKKDWKYTLITEKPK